MKNNLINTNDLSFTPLAHEFKLKFGLREDLAQNLAKYCSAFLETHCHEKSRKMAGISLSTQYNYFENHITRKIIGFYEQSIAFKAQDVMIGLLDAESEDVKFKSSKFLLESHNSNQYDAGIRREKARVEGDASLHLFKQQISDDKEAKKLERLDPFLDAEVEPND